MLDQERASLVANEALLQPDLPRLDIGYDLFKLGKGFLETPGRCLHLFGHREKNIKQFVVPWARDAGLDGGWFWSSRRASHGGHVAGDYADWKGRGFSACRGKAFLAVAAERRSEGRFAGGGLGKAGGEAGAGAEWS